MTNGSTDQELLAALTGTEGLAEGPSVNHEDAGAPERAVLDVTHLDLPVATEAAIAALIKRNDPPTLFVRSGQLVRLDRDRKGRLVVKAADLKIVRHAVAESSRCVRISKEEGEVNAPPPQVLVENVMATPSIDLPELAGIVHAPYFTSDGRAVTTPGYDAGSELMLVLGDAIAGISIPASPSASEVAVALAVVDDVLTDFPFATPADRAHAFALLLLPFVREMIDGPTPLFFVMAPKAGTGKGLLVQVGLYPACGPIAMVSPGRDEEEWRKRITSMLLAGNSYIVVDNVTGLFASANVASILTKTEHEDRLLGANVQVRLRHRTVWAATGNNVRLSDELTRRTILIRLDAGVERPEDRDAFRHPDLLDYVAQNRATLVQAAMTLVQAWVAGGRPPGRGTLGSFEAWGSLMGGILDIVGVPDFLANRDELYETANDEVAAWGPFVSLWANRFGEHNTIVSQLVCVAEESDIDLGVGDEKSRATKLGRRLVALRDRVFGSWRIERRSVIQGKTQWGLRRAGVGPVGPSTSDLNTCAGVETQNKTGGNTSCKSYTSYSDDEVRVR